MAEGGDVSKLDCSICLTAFTVPKLLPCFHTFCLQCLDEYVKRNGQDREFECPLCRACTVLPEGGVKSFQSNFYIQTGSLSEDGVVCDVCGDGHDATHHCMNCEENFCERCTTAHLKMKISREHAVEQISGSSDKSGEYTRKIQKKYYCSHHKGEEVKMVCKDCDFMLCVVCKLTEHENHNTSSITKEAEERREALSESVAEATHVIDILQARKCMTTNIANDVQKNLGRSISELEAREELMIADIKKGADTIKQTLIKNNTEAKNYYDQKERQIERNITEKQAVINHAQNVVDTGDDFQVMDRELESKLQDLASAEDFMIEYKDHMIFEGSRSTRTVDLIGKTSKVCCVVDVKELNQLYVDCEAQTTPANVLSLTKEMLYAAFTDSSCLFYHKLQTFESHYTERIYSHGTCAGLTCIDSDVFFTTIDDKAVYKLKTQTHEKTKFESFEQFPHGIASGTCRSHDKCDKKELLICVLRSKKLYLNANEGCVISICLGNKEKTMWRKKEIPGPACIATNEVDGTVCLGYPAAHKVTLNTSKGIVLTEFSGEQCPGDRKIFCPLSVCFDRCCCMIVADYKNGTVIRLDRLGNFLQCLVQTKTPLSVVCGENNMLYVGFRRAPITRYKLVPKI